jgi:hypothetical protein
VKLLGLLQQGASFRPHLVFRVTRHANLMNSLIDLSARPRPWK